MLAFFAGTVPAGAQADIGDANGFVDVIEVNGLIDPVLAEFVQRSLDQAAADGARAVVLQMESGGVTVDDATTDGLIEQIERSDIPVSVWLGPAGKGAARGDAASVAVATTRIGVSPGSEIEFPDGATLDYDTMIRDGSVVGVPVQDAPALLNHLLELPEFEFRVYQPGERVPNGPIVGDAPIRAPLTATRFITLPLLDQQFHTFSSPPVAYLLFVIGLGLLVFELFTAGVGVAGVVGAGCFLAGSYGLAVLDARWWAVALLLLAFVAFAIDVQAGIQQFWSGVGFVALVIGSATLLGDHDIGWLPLLVGMIGVSFAMLGGMPAMVRTRFSTPTIGREWMIGEVGEVIERVDPEGVVTLRGAPWRARTNRATPISAGERARVVEVDGLLLEVEPEEGGAKDYRERRGSS
ncbi:MAG: hypothetical protein HKO87_02780 [Acidimicrobiia bacterium]|nr:hypothetical protein [Acidimicrobiia bacterium]